ncbi:hypothetical protein ACFSWE_09400 [Leucobacter albus]|uniref:Uncharacterized protein n=1 Tax=Leucobacter albus TaxID=272210 RepID=A0ABW3TQU9_9MICO
MTHSENTPPEPSVAAALPGTNAAASSLPSNTAPAGTAPASTQTMADSWGASVALFAAGSLLWPLVFFLAFFARAGMLAADNNSLPHYGGAWNEIIEVVAISGSYVGWVAPSLLALLVGLGFLVTPTADVDSQSVLKPLPFVAALIGGFMLAWTVLSVVVLATHAPTATSEGGQQLWGLMLMTPVAIVLSLVLGRLDFRPAARRAELLQRAVTKLEREHEHLVDAPRFYRGPAVVAHAARSPWRRPLVVHGCLTVVVFFAFWLGHGEPPSAALLEAGYLLALGALMFFVVAIIQRDLIDARLAALAGHEVRSKLETVGGVVLAVLVALLLVYNLWFVLSGIRPPFLPVLYAAAFLAAVWIANPLTLRRSAWPAQVLRERERALERMRARLAQLTGS